ncbi:MAG: hypothetical protein Q8P67_14650 [archaeon]|nr:hypothetical protein [archaeon]
MFSKLNESLKVSFLSFLPPPPPLSLLMASDELHKRHRSPTRGPVRIIASVSLNIEEDQSFRLLKPTCDSPDVIPSSPDASSPTPPPTVILSIPSSPSPSPSPSPCPSPALSTTPSPSPTISSSVPLTTPSTSTPIAASLSPRASTTH